MHIGSEAEIDLETIFKCLQNSSYDKVYLHCDARSFCSDIFEPQQRFAAITIRIACPRTTALLFSSGKLVITGSVSRQMSINATNAVLFTLQRLFPCENFTRKNYSIQNIVCSVNIPRLQGIDIKKIYQTIPENTTYQQSIFPGLIFRPFKRPIVLLIFKTGRIVVTGAQNYEDVYKGFDGILDQLKQYFVYDTNGCSSQITQD